MNQVPQMISTKDLSYITDMMEWNLTANKTAHHFWAEATNQEVKDFLCRVSSMHKNHYETLLNLLK